MVVKTSFSGDDFAEILSQYELGIYIDAEPVTQGKVQTNYFIRTSRGKFVFRYYENRSIESALFEGHLLVYLNKHNYPCPVPIKSKGGALVGAYREKPYMLFEFIAGQPVDQLDERQKLQLIQKAAELHNLTRRYRPRYKKYRWNYNVDLCRKLAQVEAAKINTKNAQDKLTWLEDELALLHLPRALPKGICHCDFHISNILFQEDRFAALIDFDDANYTFLLYDLVGLIESWAWPFPSTTLDTTQAHLIVQEYMKHRPISAIEQRHLYDVYKLSILIDCVWFFARGDSKDFYEKRKIDSLNHLGRSRFFEEIFQK